MLKSAAKQAFDLGTVIERQHGLREDELLLGEEGVRGGEEEVGGGSLSPSASCGGQ